MSTFLTTDAVLPTLCPFSVASVFLVVRSKYPEADILTSSDQLKPTVRTEDLEQFPEAGSAFNIGIMMFRPTSKEFVGGWARAAA